VDAIEPGRLEEMRSRRLKRRKYEVYGPNQLWHTDGYDKLKPFGFCIHGTIDGWSRKLMWLRAGVTNNDPRIICQYYVDTVRNMRCIPQTLRMDPGTENVNQADVQELLREPHNNEIDAPGTMFGSSVHNQRIERFWGCLTTTYAQHYRDEFKDLRDSGILDVSDVIHRECLKLCYMGIIQMELDQVRVRWNLHKVREMKHVLLPSGKPDFMYFNPEVYGALDMGLPFDEEMLDACEVNHCLQNNSEFGCDDEVAEVLLDIMIGNNWGLPRTSCEALDLFLKFSLKI
jgi:hypothetical protein